MSPRPEPTPAELGRWLQPAEFDTTRAALQRSRFATLVVTACVWFWLPIIIMATRYSVQVRQSPSSAEGQRIGAANTGWYWGNLAAQGLVSIALLLAGAFTYWWLYRWFAQYAASQGETPAIMVGVILAFVLGPIGVLVLTYYVWRAFKRSGDAPLPLILGWAATFFVATLAQVALANILDLVGTPGVDQATVSADKLSSQIASLQGGTAVGITYAVALTLALSLWWRIMATLQARLDVRQTAQRR